MTQFRIIPLGLTAAILTAAALPGAAQNAAPVEAPAVTAEAPAAAAPVALPGSDRTIPAAGAYTFDPAHSQIVFDYNHMGFSTSHGFVNGVEGRLMLDPANIAASSVEASFPLSALRTIDAELDKHIMGPDFFNVTGEMPVVTFKSTSVVADGDDEALVTGDLTLNGITRSVVLEVEFDGAGLDPMTQAETVGFTAETEIRRSDFNLSAFVPAVSDEVDIEINVEARRD